MTPLLRNVSGGVPRYVVGLDLRYIPVNMMVADGLVPIWCQNICDQDDNVD